jgi:hypothetical protein
MTRAAVREVTAAMGQALRHDEGGRVTGRERRDPSNREGRLPLGGAGLSRTWVRNEGGRQPGVAPLCAGCRAKEARYGFSDVDGDPSAGRERTLCFGCFRMEISRRQAVAARLARGWNARQVRLPLHDMLDALTRRRRRAQIAARHALENDPNVRTI